MAPELETSAESFFERRVSIRNIVSPEERAVFGTAWRVRANENLLDSACVASVVRVTTFNQVDFADITYTIVDASMWSTIEQSVGIICACPLTFQPLFGRVFAKVRGSKNNESDAQAQSKFTMMHRLRPNWPFRTSRDAVNENFFRLDEESDVGNRITTRVTTAGQGTLAPHALSGIVMDHAIEQRHEYVSRA